MAFQVLFTGRAKEDLDAIRADRSRRNVLRAVTKSIGFLAENPRHPSLRTHQYHSIPEVYPGQKVWEAYAQDRTPAEYRVFWCYGPSRGQITIVAITPHP